jgi:hypothetical protein
LVRDVIEHAVDCISAHRRGEKLPEKTEQLREAEGNVDAYPDWQSGQ